MSKIIKIQQMDKSISLTCKMKKNKKKKTTKTCTKQYFIKILLKLMYNLFSFTHAS
jgi:hypothetical protein